MAYIANNIADRLVLIQLSKQKTYVAIPIQHLVDNAKTPNEEERRRYVSETRRSSVNNKTLTEHKLNDTILWIFDSKTLHTATIVKNLKKKHTMN